MDSAIVSKVWNFANVLRDDGVGYGDYLEQITYLLFLKMADELNKPPYNKGLPFPKLKNAQGEEDPHGETCDMTSEHLQEFVKLYNPENRHKRTETWSEENPEGRGQTRRNVTNTQGGQTSGMLFTFWGSNLRNEGVR